MKGLLMGTLGVGALVASGAVLWRAWRNRAWSAGKGVAYRPWHSWPQTDVPLGLVHAGILAANAHNSQPWRFKITNDTLLIYADFERHLGSFDPFRREMHLSLGCALENVAHAARAEGLEAQIEMPPGSLGLPPPTAITEPAAIVRLVPTDRAVTELFLAIPRRHTHRGAYRAGYEIPEPFLAEMKAFVSGTPSIRLFLFTGSEKESLAKLIVSATEAIIADRQMATDNALWFRSARMRYNSIVRLTLDTNVIRSVLNVAAKIFHHLMRRLTAHGCAIRGRSMWAPRRC